MNERIRELWEKAAESTAAYPSGQNTSWETQVNFLDKFAELIVQECVDWIDGSPSTDAGQLVLTKSFIIANIKEYFGVE
jgi:hypothetical protein